MVKYLVTRVQPRKSVILNPSLIKNNAGFFAILGIFWVEKGKKNKGKNYLAWTGKKPGPSQNSGSGRAPGSGLKIAGLKIAGLKNPGGPARCRSLLYNSQIVEVFPEIVTLLRKTCL